MATADNTRHLRYLLLFGEGGILILRAVLERGFTNSGKTVDELLQTNKRHFNRVYREYKKQYEKLFPPNGIVDRDTWDISLLCTVILQLFGNSLTSDERGGIRTLRDLRNDLAHSASFSRDEQAYNDERRDVESILITLSNELDRSVHVACQDLIQRCVTGPLDMQADTERVKELSRYDEKFSEQFRILTERVEGIAERVENVEEKVEFIAERVKEQEDLTFFLRNMVRENADFHVFQVLRTVLTLRGPNARLTSLGNKAILTVFTTALKRTGDGENLSELETEVMNILDEIERCNGVKVGEAESKCVKISMQCRTCNGLLELLEYLQGDAFRKRLLNLVLAVEEMFKGVFNITFEIERESLKEILHSLQNSTLSRREVIGADDNPDGQSGATVQETARFKQVHLKLPLYFYGKWKVALVQFHATEKGNSNSKADDGLYVYTDLCKESIVYGEERPLQRRLEKNGKGRWEYTPFYVPVRNQELREFEIYIKPEHNMDAAELIKPVYLTRQLEQYPFF